MVTFNDLITYSLLKVLALVAIFIGSSLWWFLLGKLLTSVLNSSAILGTANRTGVWPSVWPRAILITYVVFLLVIPFLGTLDIIKITDTYTDSVVLNAYEDLLLLLNGSKG
jgi:hypothetical protein